MGIFRWYYFMCFIAIYYSLLITIYCTYIVLYILYIYIEIADVK